MRNELLKELRLEDLSGELTGTGGGDRHGRLSSGSSTTMKGPVTCTSPKPRNLIRPVRDELIRREYNGKNVIALARKYSLTDRSIREIVKDKAAQLREEERKERLAPPTGQISFWG